MYVCYVPPLAYVLLPILPPSLSPTENIYAINNFIEKEIFKHTIDRKIVITAFNLDRKTVMERATRLKNRIVFHNLKPKYCIVLKP